MHRKWAWLAAAAVLFSAWVLGIAWDYFDHSSIPHAAIQSWLKLFGSSIYEYHSKTGQWPHALDDLAQTSLPATMPGWRQTAAPVKILWRDDLNIDPKENADVLLLYYEGGMFSKLGRVWVCWGDLRTEYIPVSDLRARLAKEPAAQ